MKHILISVGIVALATAGWWWTQRNTGTDPFTGESAALSPSATSTPSLAPTSTGSLAPKPAVKKPAATATPKPSPLQAIETYQDALAIYGISGYRFQFTENCQTSPGILTIKVGQKFMLDNRDGAAHAFMVGSQKYTLGAYGFAIAFAPGTAGNTSITCDGNTRATIVVQP